MTSGIYTITCVPTGKQYVGSSQDVKSRWRMHKHMLNVRGHHSAYLQNVWHKYGPENFEWSIIEVCEVDQLIIAEQRHIDTLQPALNMAPIAGTRREFKPTPEQNQKQSERGRQRYAGYTAEEVHRRTRPLVAHARSPENRQAKAQQARAQWQDATFRLKVRQAKQAKADKYIVDGSSYTVMELSEKYGIKVKTLYCRLAKGETGARLVRRPQPWGR